MGETYSCQRCSNGPGTVQCKTVQCTTTGSSKWYSGWFITNAGIYLELLFALFGARSHLVCGHTNPTQDTTAIQWQHAEENAVMGTTIASWGSPWWRHRAVHDDVVGKSMMSRAKTRYNTYTLLISHGFLWSTHNKHPIAHPWGRAMGCLLWV